jgi:hypothetical protein
MYKKLAVWVFVIFLAGMVSAPPKFNSEGFLERPSTPEDMGKYLDDSMRVLEMGIRFLLDKRSVCPERVDLAVRVFSAQFPLLQKCCMSGVERLSELSALAQLLYDWDALAFDKKTKRVSPKEFVKNFRIFCEKILNDGLEPDAWGSVHTFMSNVFKLLECLKVELEDPLHVSRFSMVVDRDACSCSEGLPGMGTKAQQVQAEVAHLAQCMRSRAAAECCGRGSDDAVSVGSMGSGLTEAFEEGEVVEAPVDYSCFEPFLPQARLCVGVALDADEKALIASLVDAVHIFSVQLLVDSGRISFRDVEGSCAKASRFKAFKNLCMSLKEVLDTTKLYCDSKYSFIEDIEYVLTESRRCLEEDYKAYPQDYNYRKVGARQKSLDRDGRTDFVFKRKDVEGDVASAVVAPFAWIMDNEPRKGLSLLRAFYTNIVMPFYGPKNPKCDLSLRNARDLLVVFQPSGFVLGATDEFNVDDVLKRIEGASSVSSVVKKTPGPRRNNKKKKKKDCLAAVVPDSPVSSVTASEGSCSPNPCSMGAGSGLVPLDLDSCRDQSFFPSLFDCVDDGDEYQKFMSRLKNKKWALSLEMIDPYLAEKVDQYVAKPSQEIFRQIIKRCWCVLEVLRAFTKTPEYKMYSCNRDVFGSVKARLMHVFDYDHAPGVAMTPNEEFFRTQFGVKVKTKTFLEKHMAGFVFKECDGNSVVKVKSLALC